MMGLTLRQRECLDFIRAHVKEKGVSPTFDEIRVALGLSSKSGIHRLIHALVERGLVRTKRLAIRADGVAVDTFTAFRGIQLVAPEDQHGSDCLCMRCPARRLQYQQIIEGLQGSPKFGPKVRLDGLRALNDHDRLRWRQGFPSSPVARKRTAIPTEAR